MEHVFSIFLLGWSCSGACFNLLNNGSDQNHQAATAVRFTTGLSLTNKLARGRLAKVKPHYKMLRASFCHHWARFFTQDVLTTHSILFSYKHTSKPMPTTIEKLVKALLVGSSWHVQSDQGPVEP
jgi:hypothetical protein